MARKPRGGQDGPGLAAADGGGKKASKTPPPDLKVVAGDKGLAGHASGLTEEQRQVLFFQHKAKYERLLSVKKKADADLRNTCKVAKSELGEHAVDLIKLAIKLGDEDEGAAEFQRRLDAEAEVARWMGLPLGSQGSLFQPDRRPAEEREFENGKRVGLAGGDAKLPDRLAASSKEGQAYMKGHAAGQDINFAKIKELGSPLLRGSAPETANDDGEGDDDGEPPVRH